MSQLKDNKLPFLINFFKLKDQHKHDIRHFKIINWFVPRVSYQIAQDQF